MFFTLLATLKVNSANSDSRCLPFKTKITNMDFVGAALLVGAIICLLLALQWGGNSLPWRSATVIGLFTGFAIISFVFATLQCFLGDKGTISPRVLQQRSVLMGCGFEFFLSMTLYIVRALCSVGIISSARLTDASIATTSSSISRQFRASQRRRVVFVI